MSCNNPLATRDLLLVSKTIVNLASDSPKKAATYKENLSFSSFSRNLRTHLVHRKPYAACVITCVQYQHCFYQSRQFSQVILTSSLIRVPH